MEALTMLNKTAVVILILLLAGAVLAAPVNLPANTSSYTDDEIDLGVKRMIPPPALRTDKQYQAQSLTKPIPTVPTPLSDLLGCLLKGCKWAD